MENMRQAQEKTVPEVLLPREQEQEISNLMETVMEELDKREQMAAFLRGVRFAKTLDAHAAERPGA